MTTETNSLAVSPGLRAALGYYRLVAEIGRGGMANVFLALFPNGDGTSRQVVLKQLQPDLAQDEDFRAMFEDEARLATRLHHDNVVETFDIYSDDDLCVLVMEFLDGQTLSRVRQRARKGSTVPLSIHLRVLAEVLGGLDYIHELADEDGSPLGVVHRDVTPSNIFVTYDGRVKLVDFGIAKATCRLGQTRLGVLKGKLAYMSPEAVRGEAVDRRSDLFSVGVMLWEAATGLRLWQDHDEVAIYRRLTMGDLPLRPPGSEDAIPEIMRIALRALEVDPAHRYATADDMKAEIEEALTQLGKSTRAPAMAAYMEAFFAVEREKFQKIVDDALERFPSRPISQRRLLSNEVTASYPGIDLSEPPTTVSSPSLPLSKTGGTFRTATSAYDVDPNEVPDFRPGWRRGSTLAIAAVAAAFSIAYISQSPNNGAWFMQRTPVAATAVAPAPLATAPMVTAPVGALPNPAVSEASSVVASPPAAPTGMPREAQATGPGTPASFLATSRPAPAGSTISPLDLPKDDGSGKPTITALFSAQPLHARFFLDGEPVSGNPASLRRPADDKHHRIRVEAAGYVTVWRPIDLDHSVTHEFELVPAHPTAMPAPAPAPETRDEMPKPRRAKRALDRDDPWGI